MSVSSFDRLLSGLRSVEIGSRALVGVVLLVPALVALYLFIFCIYQLVWHPLAKYPGPFWARFTNAYAGYHAYKRDTHIDIWRCHEKYGDFVRYGPNRLLINRTDALKDIYGHGSNFFKGTAYEVMRVNPVHSIFNAYDKVVHRRKRRIVSQGFSDSALRGSEPHVLEHIKQLCSRLLAQAEESEPLSLKPMKAGSATWTEPKDLAVWVQFMTLDVVSDLTFGRSFQMLQKTDMHFVDKALMGMGRRMGISFQFPAAFRKGPSGQWLDLGTWLLPNVSKLSADWVTVGRKWAMDRIDAEKNQAVRNDMMSFIISAVDPETNQQLGVEEILAEAYTLITAGGDTTSVAITSTFFYLSRNPDAYAKAAAEVRSAFASEDEIRTGSALRSCHYLRACLEEALRMSPPVCAPLYREAGSGGASVCGTYFPEGLSCAVGTYAIHHNPSYFPEPFKYRPERWLKDEDCPAESLEGAKAAFCPFSTGPRSCVAMNLAYVEMMLTVARVLWLADFKVPDGSLGRVGQGHPSRGYGRQRVDEYQLYDHWGADREGPFLQFRARETA